MILLADSGSTKTDWCLSEKGKEILHVSTKGINPFHQSYDEICVIINNELLPELGDVDVKDIHFYGSGCREEQVPMMIETLRRFFPLSDTIAVHNDLLAAARAVCGSEEGVACILGTGANSCLYDGENIVENTPPLGYILGDEGSGAVMGKLFLNAIFKGTLPSSLRDEYLTYSGLTMVDIISRVYRQPMANKFLASIVPFIHKKMNNYQVETLVIDNFRDFLRINVAPYNRLDLPIGAIGSVAYYFSEQLMSAANAESMKIGKIFRSPIDGLVKFHK